MERACYPERIETTFDLMLPSLVYCDFYNDHLFLSDPTLFKDYDHLNNRGARLFTEKLVVDCLNKIRE